MLWETVGIGHGIIVSSSSRRGEELIGEIVVGWRRSSSEVKIGTVEDGRWLQRWRIWRRSRLLLLR